MQCSKCGKKLKADMTVCPSCGTGINGEASIKENRKKQEQKNNKKKGNSIEKTSKWLTIVLVTIAALLVAGAAAFLLTANLREYNAVMELYENKEYDKAELRLQALADKGYRDSEEKLKEMRFEWIQARVDAYDYIGAQRYINYLDQETPYLTELFIIPNYAIAQLHEEKNPILANLFYGRMKGYLDADQRAEEMAKRAEEMGQTMEDFDDPEPSEEDEGKTLYYKIALKSFDTEDEAIAYKEQLAASANNISPFVDEVIGKWMVLAANHTDRIEAETRLLCLEKMGYDAEIVTEWVEYMGNTDEISELMGDITGMMQG